MKTSRRFYSSKPSANFLNDSVNSSKVFPVIGGNNLVNASWIGSINITAASYKLIKASNKSRPPPVFHNPKTYFELLQFEK